MTYNGKENLEATLDNLISQTDLKELDKLIAGSECCIDDCDDNEIMNHFELIYQCFQTIVSNS